MSARPTDAEVARCLRDGGVVLTPTDTVYGLAIAPGRQAALETLFRLKNRPPERMLPVMIASADDVTALGVAISPAAHKLLHSPYVPGALTIAFGFADGPRPIWLDGREEVAVRIPNHARMLSILRETGPLLVTSANASGQPTPSETAAILAQLHGAPDLVIEGGTIGVAPSTLVNCRRNPPVIEREGVITRDMLKDYL